MDWEFVWCLFFSLQSRLRDQYSHFILLISLREEHWVTSYKSTIYIKLYTRKRYSSPYLDVKVGAYGCSCLAIIPWLTQHGSREKMFHHGTDICTISWTVDDGIVRDVDFVGRCQPASRSSWPTALTVKQCCIAPATSLSVNVNVNTHS
jgi:hypothetical protein